MSGKSLKQQTKAINRGIVRGILFKASFVRKKKAEFGPVTAMIMNSGCRMDSFMDWSVAFECSGVLIGGRDRGGLGWQN
jgi:hypothetical protein